MNKFSPDAICPKCGCDYIEDFYAGDFYGGKIKRVCLRCGYTWHEKPLDAKDEK